MNHNYKNKKLYAFDVDGTLTESRQKISYENGAALIKLLFNSKVAIITGGSFERIKEQILDPLEKIAQKTDCDLRLENLILLPTNGGGLFMYDKHWKEKTSHKLKISDKNKITEAIQKIDRADPELANNTPYGDEIQDRGSEITYSALGDKAPLDLKKNWDPDFKKRLKIQAELKDRLPNFEVKIGGTTSIDITPKGMDKAFAIKQAMQEFDLNKNDILFFGDAVYPNGNDFPVAQLGVQTIRVSSTSETGKIIQNIIAN